MIILYTIKYHKSKPGLLSPSPLNARLTVVMFQRMIAKVLISAAALWAADYLLSGFAVSGGLRGYLIVGLILGLLNALVRPVLKMIALPLIILTLGLFTIVINALMLWLAGMITGLVIATAPLALLGATLIISAAHILLDPSTDN